MQRSSLSLDTRYGATSLWQVRTWWAIAREVNDRLGRHNSGLLAAGMAMYALLSVFPGLSAVVFIYGLFATPTAVAQQMQAFAGILPPGVWTIFSGQLQNVAAHDHDTLTWAATIGVLLALWSARLTMSALMTITNAALEIPETRGFFLQITVSVLLTLAAIAGFLIMLLIGIVVPLALTLLGTSDTIQTLVTALRWLVLWLFAVFGLALVYHGAPARRQVRWHYLTWGSTTAATLWVVISGLFGVYVGRFAGYDRVYGTLAGVVVLLMWFYLLSFSVVLGAEINSVMNTRIAAS
jgi:membrane protein